MQLRRVAVGAAVVGLLHVADAAGEPVVNANVHSFSDSRKNRVDSYLLEYQQPASRAWTLQLRGILDRVHLPPLPGLPGSAENIDAITAASRPVQSAAASKDSYLKQRKEVTGSVAWRPAEGALRAGGSYYVSHESDFLGQQASVDFARDWNEGSTSLALRTAYGYDRITPDEHTGGDPTPRSRNTADVTLTCTQSLTPRLQAQLGAEVTSIRGFQNNPYRRVFAGGDILPEHHPEDRLRRAVFAQLDRYFMTRSSVSLNARWYSDDWGIQAGSFDTRFSQYVGDRFIVRYRYRYHTQSAAWFYRDLYEVGDGVDGYRTADYKLRRLDSNLFGIKVSVPFEGTYPWLDGMVLDVKYERYFDSRNFAANVLEAGCSWPF